MGSKKKEEKEKSLEKMTAKELRESALKIQGIAGVHGMNKIELVKAIKEAKGIKDDSQIKDSTVRELKKRMREFKSKQTSFIKEENLKMAQIYKRRVNNLKKRTRRLA